MICRNIGVTFTCDCGFIGEANVAGDFQCVKCNNTDNFYITCPNCESKIEVYYSQIPVYIRPYITKKVVSWAHED